MKELFNLGFDILYGFCTSMRLDSISLKVLFQVIIHDIWPALGFPLLLRDTDYRSVT